MSQGHFEAKKWSYRQTKEGIVVAFLCHPNDLSAELATSPLGTRFIVGFAEIGDDEQPKDAPAVQERQNNADSGDVGSTPTGRSKRKFSDLSLPEQAGMRATQDYQFVAFIADTFPNVFEAAGRSPAQFIRDYCAVDSRRELSTNHDAANKWRELERAFQAHLTDQKYAGARR